MKNALKVLPVVAICIAIYILFFQVSYTGTFSLTMNNASYKLDLTSAERFKRTVNSTDRTGMPIVETSYHLTFSSGTSSVRVGLILWKEDGEICAQILNPIIEIQGKTYILPREIRQSQCSVEVYSDRVTVDFWNLQYSNNQRVNGHFILQVQNSNLLME